MKSGNLSKLVKGKFLEMFLNIVIKSRLNQHRKEFANWSVKETIYPLQRQCPALPGK